jgi:hypothetical protein
LLELLEGWPHSRQSEPLGQPLEQLVVDLLGGGVFDLPDDLLQPRLQRAEAVQFVLQCSCEAGDATADLAQLLAEFGVDGGDFGRPAERSASARRRAVPARAARRRRRPRSR